MNEMKEVAKLLGVELNEEFNIKSVDNKKVYGNPYHIEEYGLVNSFGVSCGETLTKLLIGVFEIEKTILNKAEKHYLENILRPFKDKALSVTKVNINIDDYCYISIKLKTIVNFETCTFITLPLFELNKIYKNMEENKEYTLKELGLFEEN